MRLELVHLDAIPGRSRVEVFQMDKHLALSGVSVVAIALAGVAHAADPTPYTPPAAPMVETMDWTGPYLGIHGGYGWGEEVGDKDPPGSESTTFPGPFCGDFSTERIVCGVDLDGPFLGGQVGWNFQELHNVVLGMEADLAWADFESGEYNLHPKGAPTDSHWFNDEIDLMATLRARIGIALGAADNVLPFVTGGMALGAYTSDEKIIPDGGEPTDPAGPRSNTYFGWTLGAGVEWAPFTDRRWRVKGEYRYIDFGAAHRAGRETGTTKPRDIEIDGHFVMIGI